MPDLRTSIGACVLAAALACWAAPARGQEAEGTPPSVYGKLTSRRWSWGQEYRREILPPVANPNPAPEPQPRRDKPYDVAVSPDGTKVYVALQGSELRPGHEIAVYDLALDRVVKRISVDGESAAPARGTSPYRLAVQPGTGRLWVTNRFANFVSVIDTRADRVIGEFPLDFYAQGITFRPDGQVAWIANRYLDQVFVVDAAPADGAAEPALRVLGGLDQAAFFDTPAGGGESIHQLLVRSCGAVGCHDRRRGDFVAGPDARASFVSALPHLRPGDAAHSRLLQAAMRTRHGGHADRKPSRLGHAGGVVWLAGKEHPDYVRLARWIDAGGEGPGIPVGNPRSKPKVCALSSDGRHLFVGNTGTQDVSIVDTALGREVGSIWVQNVVNDLKVYRSPRTGRDWLLVATEGVGFGVAAERDPYGGETWDRDNPAAQFSVWRDLSTGKVLPRAEQQALGPFDAVDGTAAIKFRDIQNDLLVIDVEALAIPDAVPADGPQVLLLANRYEAHRSWVRYTSDTAESTWGDLKGDIPPELMRVVGAFPEKMALVGDRLFVTMQGSNQVQEWRIDVDAADPADYLTPVKVHPTGMQPIGIAAGLPGTPSAGRLFVADFLGGTLSVIDPARGESREVVVDPSVLRLPVPATNAERGEVFVHTSLFSSDGDTSCFHCHYLDMGDGRPWGVSQVVGQEYLRPTDAEGQLVIGGTMLTPQMRALFGIQPFFLEGVLSAFEPRSMIMEHAPADDFRLATPQGDFTSLEACAPLAGTVDVQSRMASGSDPAATLEERRDEMFRRLSLRHFGKSFALRDFQRFIGEWQMAEPHLLPNPFDRERASVRLGRRLFEDPQVGCVSCHVPPHFTRKDFAGNRQQAFAPLVTTTVRDGSFTLISMNRLDWINGVRRDLEPWDIGRAEERQAHFTTFPLRGLWDRPPVFLHHGMARTLREVVAPPGHPALGTFKYEPRIGGVPERPERREVGFNMTHVFTAPSSAVEMHRNAGARIGLDTHGGTSHLTPFQIDALVDYLETIE